MSYPGYGTGPRAPSQRGKRSGQGGGGGDTTSESGQYPTDSSVIFGGPLPTGTGAPGTAGGGGAGSDPTTEPGQLTDGLTGVTDEQISSTGAPGTPGSGIPSETGPDAVSFTKAGSYLTGTYESDTVRAATGGPDDWTQANDAGYGTGGPKLPGMAEPQAGSGPFQPQGGHVMRGGRMNGGS